MAKEIREFYENNLDIAMLAERSTTDKITTVYPKSNTVGAKGLKRTIYFPNDGYKVELTRYLVKRTDVYRKGYRYKLKHEVNRYVLEFSEYEGDDVHYHEPGYYYEYESDDTARVLSDDETRSRIPLLNALSMYIIECFVQCGCKVILDDRLNDGYDVINLIASHGYFAIKNDDDSIYLGFAYFVDLVSGRTSTYQSFWNIYNREKNNFPGDNKEVAISNTTNYFNYCFKEYLFNRQRLQTFCPSSASAIQTAISKINNTTIRYAKMLITPYHSLWE